MRRIYLDHAATTPMPSRVREAYVAALGIVGNPASTHEDGQRASLALEDARRTIAQWLDAEPVEVTLTSGGTESINLAVKGCYWGRQQDRSRPIIMLSTAEHHATLEAAQWLETHEGAHIVWLPVDETGALRPKVLADALSAHDPEDVALVTFLWANNEVGTVSPVTELTSIAQAHGIPVHVDAVAAFGQVPVSLRNSGATLMSVSAHKVGGPVGVGALAISRKTQLESLHHGGSHQRGRSGTQDVAGAVAFAEALNLLDPLEEHAEALRTRRDELIATIRRVVPEATLRGAAPSSGSRLPGNVHVTFPGCQGDSMLFLLDAHGISVSVGSACQAGVQETSHVLLAMGIPEHDAIGALRLTVAADTGIDEINRVGAVLPDVYAQAKAAGIVSTSV